MSGLVGAVEDYLSVRRSLGFSLADQDRLLGSFVAHLEAAGLDTITTEAALEWATEPRGADASWHAKRLGYARRFAVYLSALDPRCEVPPRDLLPARACRARPHLYSDSEVAALMGQARLLRPRLRAATFETLIGLLAVTGMRPGEALRLDRCDVDCDVGVIRVWDSKFHDSRELALQPSTIEALAAYATLRDQLRVPTLTDSYFVSATGTRPSSRCWPARVSIHRPDQNSVGPARTIFGTPSPCAPCWAGIATAPMSERFCHPCRPTSATSTRPPPIGTCPRPPS